MNTILVAVMRAAFVFGAEPEGLVKSAKTAGHEGMAKR